MGQMGRQSAKFTARRTWQIWRPWTGKEELFSLALSQTNLAV
jgi:hypothetical protein